MKEYVRTILDYPLKGIKFRDITTLLQDSKLFSQVITEMTNPWKDKKIDAILSIESRGFIMAGAIAYNLNTAFIPLRKPDKLPGDTYKVKYTLEYGSTEMHIHKDALDNHKNLLIIDDLLATGGTAIAALDLIDKFNNKNIIGAGFIINLPDLNGEKLLKKRGINIHSLMDF
ncbi:MAG: Adenine phosphoribosyltransferase [Alphaproteobacteria bacterium MarineAlpha5_Bin9]|nr:MAG: Adenine phosphoribosyltransferase [Alphaproteobacteria bacterium MarineAlpha5_Bin9]|tara:strand:+ start:1936 stop:2451 length:516 start_codon:yes stop_codon:yes gene_type:complete